MVDKEKNLTDINLVKGIAPYRQWGVDDGISQFFACLKELMHERLQQGLKNIEQIAWDYAGNNTYIQFFYENVYGIQRGFGSLRSKNPYDSEIHYDNGAIYDDQDFFDGLMYLDLYKKLIKWGRRLDEECFTLGWLIGFVCDFCQIQPSDIVLSFAPSGVTMTLPFSVDCQAFQALILNPKIWDFFPMQNYNKITITLKEAQ